MRGRKCFELYVNRALLGCLLAFVTIVTPPLAAQTATPPLVAADTKLPAFDVISIKPNKSGSGRVSLSRDDGNFDASNVSLKTMVLNAYGLKEAQLFGLPKWDESARFDIKAKVVEPDKKVLEALTEEQDRDMLQPILTERFQLQFHHETKILPVYELVVAKGGPKFQESKITGDEKAGNGMGAGSMRIRNNVMSSTAIPLASLVGQLSSQLHRVVVDKTGLNGKYDLDLSWSPDDGAPPDPDSAAPSIFTALQEQLGLRLQPSKSPVETFVIDHVELPSED
jgi:uncharacterized protein (TIGR03435 family)